MPERPLIVKDIHLSIRPPVPPATLSVASCLARLILQLLNNQQQSFLLCVSFIIHATNTTSPLVWSTAQTRFDRFCRLTVHATCLCLLSRPRECPASRTNLSRPRPPSRGTLLHRLHLSGRLPSPRSRATPGFPAAPRPRPSPPPRATPRRKARWRVPRTSPTPSRRTPAPRTWTADRSAARPRDLWGYITERTGREARRAPR